jgi:selenocysteine lyase/cysteine desulfurase
LNPSSVKTSNKVEAIRQQLLAFFHTTSEHYSVIFTSGSSPTIATFHSTYFSFRFGPNKVALLL